MLFHIWYKTNDGKLVRWFAVVDGTTEGGLLSSLCYTINEQGFATGTEQRGNFRFDLDRIVKLERKNDALLKYAK